MKSPNRGRTRPEPEKGLVAGRGGRPEGAEPEAEERAGVDRVIRRGVRVAS